MTTNFLKFLLVLAIAGSGAILTHAQQPKPGKVSSSKAAAKPSANKASVTKASTNVSLNPALQLLARK